MRFHAGILIDTLTAIPTIPVQYVETLKDISQHGLTADRKLLQPFQMFIEGLRTATVSVQMVKQFEVITAQWVEMSKEQQQLVAEDIAHKFHVDFVDDVQIIKFTPNKLEKG